MLSFTGSPPWHPGSHLQTCEIFSMDLWGKYCMIIGFYFRFMAINVFQRETWS